MTTQAINLECVAFTLVGSFEALNLAGVRSGGRPLHQLLLRHSGAEYTPLARPCQQDIVVPNVLGAIECIGLELPRIEHGLFA
jgi:hypothetical protein